MLCSFSSSAAPLQAVPAGVPVCPLLSACMPCSCTAAATLLAADTLCSPARLLAGPLNEAGNGAEQRAKEADAQQLHQHAHRCLQRRPRNDVAIANCTTAPGAKSAPRGCQALQAGRQAGTARRQAGRQAGTCVGARVPPLRVLTCQDCGGGPVNRGQVLDPIGDALHLCSCEHTGAIWGVSRHKGCIMRHPGALHSQPARLASWGR